MTSTLIRPFRPEDLTSLAEVEQQAFGSHSYPRLFFRQAYDLFGELLQVAETKDGKIAGYVLGALLPNEAKAWIVSLAVDPDYRRQHIGELLTESLLGLLRGRKVEQALLTVDPANAGAIRLYRKFGFVDVYTDEQYFGPGEARIVMQKNLSRD